MDTNLLWLLELLITKQASETNFICPLITKAIYYISLTNILVSIVSFNNPSPVRKLKLVPKESFL